LSRGESLYLGNAGGKEPFLAVDHLDGKRIALERGDER
jgi:hypothetical protein